MTARTRSGRSLLRRSILAAGMAWSLGAADLARADDAAPATRPVEVHEPGWVKVPLDPATRARLAPDGHDLRVLDPSGAEIPFAIAGVGPAVAARGVVVAAIDETSGGWSIVLDAGEAPAPHDGLLFAFANRTAAPGVRLEASADRADWQPLASADLFRIGASAQLQQSTLRYPATDARYLRLSWPATAGYPEIQHIAVLPAPATPPPVERVPLSPVESERAPGRAAYDLPLAGPGLPLDRIELAWRGSGTAAYRLLQPDDGRWRVLAEGTLVQPTTGQVPAAIPLAGAPVGSLVLRLELAGGGSAEIAMDAASGVVPREWLVFYAPEAGRFDLAYGDLGMAPADMLASPPPLPLSEIPEVQPGTAQSRPWPDLPAAGAALGGAMPTATFAAAWDVAVAATPAPGNTSAAGGTLTVGGTQAAASTPAAVTDLPPGSVVRLDLAPELYAVARPDLADLRLAFASTDGSTPRQAPFIRWSSPIPDLVVGGPDQAPVPGPQPRTSRIVVDLPEPPLPYTELELITPARLFDRPVEVDLVTDGRPGDDRPRRQTVAAADWHCAGASALPCRLVLDVGAGGLGGLLGDRGARSQRGAGDHRGSDASSGASSTDGAVGSAPRLEIAFHDADDAPLPEVGIRLWRRSDQLVFVWPGAGTVRLMAGNPRLGAPDYDIQALEAELLARPARKAVALVRAGGGGGARGSWPTESQTHWLVLGALALAAVALLILLGRLVRLDRAAGGAAAGDKEVS